MYIKIFDILIEKDSREEKDVLHFTTTTVIIIS
jgi:hypothetical protein